ncbi:MULTISPECIES: hypothetical protein [unclassified Microbacterium]|uniref:hypothetical protein n=1 Tax=unclassified Microbacterium TaxID=2609290 RepID=UPI001602D583|nr:MULTISPECIES: hypothetical protein [unclassified Microbacterium]MBT2483418.1 hypothetical protein [Microbacterium sp. ISL-108]
MSTQETTTDTITAPRTRWAAIIWGVLFAGIAAGSLWLIADDDRRAGVTDWVTTLTPATITTLAILGVGVLLLVAGAAGLVRRAQHRAPAAPAPAVPAPAPAPGAPAPTHSPFAAE